MRVTMHRIQTQHASTYSPILVMVIARTVVLELVLFSQLTQLYTKLSTIARFYVTKSNRVQPSPIMQFMINAFYIATSSRVNGRGTSTEPAAT